MYRFGRFYLAYAAANAAAIILIAVTVLLTACDGSVRLGPVEVGIEPTATPVPTPTLTPTPAPTVETYRNAEYGFAFDYLSAWTLSEEPHFVRLRQEDLQLTIGYRWATETASLGNRTGMPAGTLIYSAKVVFLGEVIPGHTLEYEHKAKAVYYGENGQVEAGDLQFNLYLEAPDGRGYETLDIPELVQAEVKVLLESFRRIEATGQPPALSPTPPPVPARTPTPAPSADQVTIVGWYGSVHSAPEGSGYDDYLVVLPTSSDGVGAAEVGLVGLSPADEAAIAELRDKEPPNKYAHFWGTLACGVDDYGGCQLTVTHLRPDGPGPMLNPDPVEGWEGTVVTSSAWAQIDDAFVLAGDYPVQYGIWAEDVELDLALQRYRNSGIPIRVWGQLLCGVPDAGGCQIQVQRFEEAPAAGEPPAAESPTPKAQWASYDNEEYGFSFQYPTSWTLEEIPGRDLPQDPKQPAGAMPARCADAVVLTRGTLALTVGYMHKRPSEDGPVAWCDIAMVREPTDRGTVLLMGRDAYRNALAYQGAVKAVDVGLVDEDADLVLQIALRDSSTLMLPGPEMASLPESALVELDQILSSFEPFE